MIKRTLDGKIPLPAVLSTYGITAEDVVAVIELPENEMLRGAWLGSDSDCVSGELHFPVEKMNLPKLVEGQMNEFVLCPTEFQLDIILVDSLGHHLPNCDYEIVLEETTLTGNSDSEGALSESFETIGEHCLLIVTLPDGSQRHEVYQLDHSGSGVSLETRLAQQGFDLSKAVGDEDELAFLYEVALMFSNNIDTPTYYIAGENPMDDSMEYV